MTTMTAHSGMRADPPAAPVESTLAVVLDHAHARFFVVAGEKVREVECLASPRMRGGKFHSDRQGSPGWGERGFHGRRHEEERRHYTAVARRLSGLVRTHGASGVVIGGSRRVVAEFREALSPTLARVVLGTALLNATAVSGDAVRRAVRAARATADLTEQRAWVAAVTEAFGRGRAVEGIVPVLLALERNQVHMLLLDPRLARAGFRGARSGRLVASKDDVVGEPVVRVPDLVAAVVLETRRQRAPVIEITDRRLAARFDGIAVLLRYR